MRLLGTVPARSMSSAAVHFWEGDVLYGRLRPYLNKVYRSDFEGLCSAEFIVFPEEPYLSARFLAYFLNSRDFVNFATHLNEGDRPRVDFIQIGAYTLDLPPLAEQRRIVARIEELLSQIDAGVDGLRALQKKLRRYRAAVLKAACEGTLVPTEAELARAENRDYEPASVLLARVLGERRARWETDQLAKMRVRGAEPKDDKWKGKYEESAVPDTSGLPELPEGWMRVSAAQLCDFITKGTTPAADKMTEAEGEVPYIKVYNLTHSGSLDFTIRPTFINRSTHYVDLARSRTYPGDVLMNIVGPPLGKVSIVPDSYPEWNVNQAIAIFRPALTATRPWLKSCLLNDSVLNVITRKAKATAGQYNLTLEQCRGLPLPLPPLAEQERIVAEVERRLSVLDQMEATLRDNLKRADRLRQAVLRDAFAGKLVPQDPADEPAADLLARIRAERESASIRSREGKMTGGLSMNRGIRASGSKPRLPNGQVAQPAFPFPVASD